MKKLRINGWVLTYTLTLIVISTLILYSIVMIYGFQKQAISNIWRNNKFMLDRRSALNFYISQSTFPIETTQINTFQIKENLAHSFSTLEILSIHGGDTVKSMAQIGSRLEKNAPIVILPKSPYPLKISGTSRLKGLLKVPYGKIEKYNGLSSKNDFDISQITLSSSKENELPPAIPNFKTSVESHYVESLSKLKNAVSFSTKSQSYFSTETIIINDKFSGNITIESSKKIIIKRNAELHMITVKAPVILIEDHWTGQATFIAENNIQVGKNVTINYPSSLMIKDYIPSEEPFTLPINSAIYGSLDIRGENKKNTPIIYGNIFGNLYSNLPINFQGRISGQIWVPHFSYATSGSSYINLTNNASFNNEFQSKKIPLTIFYPGQKKAFIQWLN